MHSTVAPLVVVWEEGLRYTPWISPDPLGRQNMSFPMRVLVPLINSLSDPLDCILVGTIHHTRGINPDEMDAVQRKVDSTTVTVNEASALESMAHDS
jgi:hypothetical protein